MPAVEKRGLKLVRLFRVDEAGRAGGDGCARRVLPSWYRHTGMWRRFHSLVDVSMDGGFVTPVEVGLPDHAKEDIHHRR